MRAVMEAVRTVLIGVPRLLADVLGEALEGVAIAAAYEEGKALASAVGETRADLLIMRMRPGWDEELAACLERHPRMRALAIDRDERGGVVCELRPYSSECRPLDLAVLAEAIDRRPDWRFKVAQ
jgi:hypothetical protein